MEKIGFLIHPSLNFDNTFPFPPFFKFTIYRLIYGGKDGRTLKHKIPVANHKYLEEAIKDFRTRTITDGITFLEGEKILQAIQESDRKIDKYLKEQLEPAILGLLEEKKKKGKLIKKKRNILIWNEEKRQLKLEEERRLKALMEEMEKFGKKKAIGKKKLLKKK